MKAQFENLKYLYGDCSVRIPNSIFRDLSEGIKKEEGSINSRHTSLSYAYLVTIAFLYKYTHYVDVDTDSYLQNRDLKLLLGYNTTSKTIDKVIKKDGILDKLEMTKSTRDYPIRFNVDGTEEINGIPLREITTISEIDEDDVCYEYIKKTVKNRNYEVKIPLFMTGESPYSEYGTFYSIERTHDITISELISFIFDDELDNTAFFIYGYIKSRCKGHKGNKKNMTFYKMMIELGITQKTFHDRLDILVSKNYINVKRNKWKVLTEETVRADANVYTWLGVKEYKLKHFEKVGI